MFILTNYTCGGLDLTMDEMIPKLVHLAVTAIQIAVPILLVIFGMLDLGKSVMAQKEDEIKKGQQLFLKRLIAAVIVFLVVVLVRLVIGLVAPSDPDNNIWNCFDCLVNGVDKCTAK